ncbi:hypothetical protein CPAV1605_1138 [seawater metagenome]|uniref:RING-type domain-containing protein n=1 Tax=seawater metagenome TaxID=1561972 RepID=A0A5E8CK10_9ZZZZ
MNLNNTLYEECGFNITKQVNCTQIIEELEEECYELYNCSIDDNNNPNSNGLIILIIILSIFLCPVICVFVFHCNCDKFFANMGKCINNCLIPFKKCGKCFKQVLFCSKCRNSRINSNIDIEKGITNEIYNFTISNCSFYTKISDEIRDNNCSICLDQLIPPSGIIDLENKIINLRCNHNFHINCLKPWIIHQLDQNQIPSCPLCRKEIGECKPVKREIYYNVTYDNDSDSDTYSYSDY